MKEALYYKKKGKGIVQCHLCPWNCVIADGKRGVCKVRENQKGKLYSLVYAKPCSIAVDPIEKKPLFHFMPGHSSYSIGTVGCNLHCKFCQNWTTSQASPESFMVYETPPEKVVEEALANGCKSIAYTYNEPIIFYEYVWDTAKLARKAGLKNVLVSNGFINEEPLKKLSKYIDAANIDLKAFDDGFYRKITTAWLEPVLESLKLLVKNNVWLEITNLIIPGLNDDPKKIEEMCIWIKNSLGKDVPLHFSRFFPQYNLQNTAPTPAETLIKARDIAKKAGLNYVYAGNIAIEGGSNTYCPKCNKLLVERGGFEVYKNNIKNGKCSCAHKIAGVWE